MIDLRPGFTVKLTKNVSFRTETHIFWRQNANGAVYNKQGAVLRGDEGSNESYIGSETDLALTWQIDRHSVAYIGYSHFFAGSFIRDTGAHDDIDFAYAAFVFTF